MDTITATRRAPSTIGGTAVAGSPIPASTSLVPAESTALTAPFLNKGTIVISEDQVPAAEQMLAALNFQDSKGAEIVTLGSDVEGSFNSTLDAFMARLDKNSAAPVFALFDRLEKGVKDADLEKVLAQVETAQPGMITRALGKLRGKSLTDLKAGMFEQTRTLLSGKTKNLSDSMKGLETDLKREVARLLGELSQLGLLKETYRNQFKQFALVAAVAQAYVAKAEDYVARRKQELASDNTMQAKTEIQELEVKLQMLKSRALALEAVYTRLPNDQEVLRQIENAGVTTLGETMTTAASRFASIKMTLLALHGALSVKSVQNATARLANLDDSLLKVRGNAVKGVAVSAASAPGENRLAQAEQIKRIVAETKDLYAMVAKARSDNETKFATARATFEQARADLLQIESANPSPTVSVT